MILAIVIITMTFLFVNLNINKIDVHYDSEICIEPDDGYMYKTCQPIFYKLDNDLITVPSQFKTDLATIPRAFWSFINPARSDLMGASILHDFLYQCPGNITRKDADDIFFNALISHNVDKITALKFYVAIRLFGSNHFDTSDYDCYPGEDDGYIETRRTAQIT